MHHNSVGKLAHGKRRKYSAHEAFRSSELCDLSQRITLQMRRLEVMFSEFQELSQHSHYGGKRRLTGNSHSNHRLGVASPTRKASKLSRVWKRKPGANSQAKTGRFQKRRLDEARIGGNDIAGHFEDPQSECDAIGSVYHSPASPQSVSASTPVLNQEVCTTCDTLEHDDSSVSKWLRPQVLASVSSFVLGIENSSFEKRSWTAKAPDPISEPVPIDEDDDLDDDPLPAFKDRRRARQHTTARSSNPTARSSNDPCPVDTSGASNNTGNFAQNEGNAADQVVASLPSELTYTPQSGASKRRAQEISSPVAPVQLFDYGAGDGEVDSAEPESGNEYEQTRQNYSQRLSWSTWFFAKCGSNAGQIEDEAARERNISDQISRAEEELRLIKEAELAAQPKLLMTRLVSGREVIVDVKGVQSIAEVRGAISAKLGLDHNFGLKLLRNCNILEDGSALSEIDDLIEKKEELTVIVERNNLRWRCPPQFIRQEGVEVQEIIWDCRWDGYVYVLEDGTENRNKGTAMLDQLFASLRSAPHMVV